MAGGEVSASVCSIVAAFANCRDIFRRACERPPSKSKPTTKSTQKHREQRLSKSLARGPEEIEAEYARGASFGPSFTIGDADTQRLLTKTLLNLNTGLVDIISQFLSGRNSDKVRLDYNTLTVLSDTSRVQARDGLANLRQRLSQRPPIRALSPKCTHCQEAPHPQTRVKPRKALVGPPGPHKVSKFTGGKVDLVPIKDSNQKQLALIRQRNIKRRSPSTSSTSSHSSEVSLNSSQTSGGSTTPTSLCSSCSGGMAYTGQTAVQHFSQNRQPLIPAPKAPAKPIKAPPKRTTDTAPRNKPTKRDGLPCAPPPTALEQHRLMYRPQDFTSHPIPVSSSCPRVSAIMPQELPAEPNQTAIPRRRQDKTVESIYSFKSDSTKLGEIPLHKWNEPFDWDEMERLNAEAEAAGWASVPSGQVSKPNAKLRGRKGGVFARMFKKDYGRMNTINE